MVAPAVKENCQWRMVFIDGLKVLAARNLTTRITVGRYDREIHLIMTPVFVLFDQAQIEISRTGCI